MATEPTQRVCSRLGWRRRAGSFWSRQTCLSRFPLHWTRLFARRYNQAALLAQAVGRLAKAKVAPDLLKRRKRTPSLAHSGARERAETVRGAFLVPEERRPEVEGGRILIIDDVFTTGATVAACARALARSSARAVDVLTVARVVRPSASAISGPGKRQANTPGGEESEL
jgi:predicted amidophosphoribosyltransferase